MPWSWHRRSRSNSGPQLGTESDVPVDPCVAHTRAPSGAYVGRTGPDDVGYVGETGAEARAARDHGQR